MANIRIYDNGGKSFDRYTAIDIDRPERQVNMFSAIGFSADPFHPQGFGQHTSAMPGRHLGKRVKLADLPPDARKFVEQFTAE
jgi:hypothetical protein